MASREAFHADSRTRAHRTRRARWPREHGILVSRTARARDATAIRDAAQFLEDEGYVGHEDNVLGDEELRWAGNVLTVHSRGSMPHASFEICSDVLRLWAQYARDGDVVALNVEDGLGERYLAGNGDAAGGACIELGADEVAALRLAYGWKVTT